MDKTSTSSHEWSKPYCFSFFSYPTLPFLLLPGVSSGRSGGDSDMSLGLSESTVCARLVASISTEMQTAAPQHSRDSCLLCRSIRTARFPRVRATNQIVISFTGLTQKTASSKRTYLFWQNLWGNYFMNTLNLTFTSERKMAKLYSRQWWPSVMLGLDFGLVSPINWVNHFGKMSYSLLVCFSLCKLRNDGNKEKEVEVCHLHLVCTHIVLNSELFFFSRSTKVGVSVSVTGAMASQALQLCFALNWVLLLSLTSWVPKTF